MFRILQGFVFIIISVFPLLLHAQKARVAHEEEITAFLDLHNQFRTGVGVDSLQWSNELAEYAREWAGVLAKEYGCNIRHRPRHGKYTQQYGENIYIMWGGEPEVKDVLQSWGEEKVYYNGEPIGNIKSDHTTGHYTQIVWNETKRVGCARVKCNKNRGTYIWVCNYDPPGNWVGEKPYNEKPGK
ncbi:MAG: hypothetical protein K9J27_06940 [Bacteroidales bacterium]|nr:hypothetical protein [Bacteroidales bacterium]MCF8333700.1 hypothetical protein [Bacteroidales bacterium]